MSSVRKQVVERYIEGFRTQDHELILGCLTDDVTWEMPPYFSLSGKQAFDDEIENPATPGVPQIQIVRLVEEGDVVVAAGTLNGRCTESTRRPADSSRSSPACGRTSPSRTSRSGSSRTAAST